MIVHRSARRLGVTTGLAVICGAAAIVLAGPATARAGAPGAHSPAVPAHRPARAAQGVLYVLQGLPGRSVDVSVGGKRLGTNLPARTVLGPIRLAAGRYHVHVTVPDGGQTLLDRVVTVRSGQSSDAVVHLAEQATPTITMTVFGNDTHALPPGKTRMAIAHTADVPPADIRVDGKVLFSNVANGEGLTTVMPAGSYRVSIVPTGTTGPAVLGPATFHLKSGTFTRVFAIGDPSTRTMNVIVQTFVVETVRAGRPAGVNTGSGGRAAPPVQTVSTDAGGALATAGLGLSSLAVLALALSRAGTLRRRTRALREGTA